MDNLEILIKAILSLKDVEDSKKQIASELPKLESQLQSDEKARIKIVAGLDVQKSRDLIQSQLNALTKQAKSPVIKVGIDVGQNNTIQGVTSSLKEIQSQAQQAAKSVNNVVTSLNPNQISDKAVKNFQKALGITGKQAQQTTDSFRQLMSQLHSAWYSEDVNAYNTALEAVHTQIVQNYESIKTHKKQIQELSNVYRSTLTDGSQVLIYSDLRKDLQHSIQDAEQLKKILDTVYGVGKWSYKKGVSADALLKSDDEYMSTQKILDVYKQICSVKEQLIYNTHPEDYDTQIKGLLNLKTVYTDINGVHKEYINGLGWRESASNNAIQNINEETAAVKQETAAYEKLKAIKETTKYDSLGQKISRTSVYGDVSVRKISRYDEDDNLTSYAITENYEALAKSIDKAEAKATKLEQRLMSIYASAERGSKPIQDSSHWDKLAKQAEIANNAIDKIRQADVKNAASIEATANAEISKLQDLIHQYKNAEYAAEALRTKDIGTVKNIQTQELDKFINKINGSKVPIDNMTTDVNELKTALASVGDKDGLTKFLNQFDIAKAKFESLKTLYQSISGYDKQFDNLAKTWKKQGIYASNLKTTIEELKSSLANVKTADGLTSWIEDFNSQIGAISQLPVKIAEYKNQLLTVKTEWDKQHNYVQSVYNAFGKLGSRLGSIKTEAGFDKWVKDFETLVLESSRLKTNLDSQVVTQNKIYEIQVQIAKLNPSDIKNTPEIARLEEKLAIEKKTLSNLKFQANVYNNLVSYEEQEQFVLKQTADTREKLASATSKAEGRAAKEQERVSSQMQKGIEQTIQARREEEKRQQLAQSNAINKALEQEYIEQQKLQEQINKTYKQYIDLFNALSKNANKDIWRSVGRTGVDNEINAFNTALQGLKSGTHTIEQVQTAFTNLQDKVKNIEKIIAGDSSFKQVIRNYNNLSNVLNKTSQQLDKLKSNQAVNSSVNIDDLTSQLDNAKTKLKELQQLEARLGKNGKWAEQYHLVNNEVEILIRNINLAEQASKDDVSTENKLRLEYMQKLTQSYNQLISLKNKFAKSTNADNKAIYQTEIKQTEEIIRNLAEQFQTSGLITQVYQEQIDRLKHQVALTDEINKNTTQANAVKQSQQAFKEYYNDVQKTTKAVETAISSLNQLNNSTTFKNNASNPQVVQTKQELSSLINEYQKLYAQLQVNPTSQGLETLKVKLDELNSRVKTATRSASAFERQLKEDNSVEQQARRVAVLKAQIEAYANANKRSQKQFGGQFNDMLSILNNSPDKLAVDGVAKQFQTLKQEINKAGLAGKTFFQQIGDSIKKFTSWMSMTYAISTFTRYVRSAITELKEIDTILTEISKTSDRTEESLRKLGQTSFATASKYGQKASDYLLGVQEMSRAGFGEKESEQMAELSTLVQSAGDMEAELANSYLIATNAAYQFGGSAEKLNSVLNSQNFITNRNALNMTELANATKVAGSQSAVSSVAIDEMTAAVGTMIATTQEGGETAGRAFKAILMNLQQVSASADDIGDGGEDITTESLTKYEKACADLGVSLKEVKNGVVTLREPMEILEELAVSVSKEAEGSVKVANLINAIGGKVCHVA